MATSRSYQCLSCRLKDIVLEAPAKVTRRHFSSSKSASQRKPRNGNVKAEDMGVVIRQPRGRQVASHKSGETSSADQRERPYTQREKQLLALKYTPQQMAAITAGEATIPQGSIASRRPRPDQISARYMDDFSKIMPVVDKPVRAPNEDIDPNVRVKSEGEIIERLQEMSETIETKKEAYESRISAMKRGENVEDWYDNLEGQNLSDTGRQNLIELDQQAIESLDQVEWEKVLADPATVLHSPKGTLNSQQDVLAPEIPKYKSGFYYLDETQDPHLARLSLQTGMKLEDIRKLRVKNLVRHRVVNQTRMGKISSQYYLSIAGNQNGMIGIGEGKAAEDEDARRQAMMSAIRSMVPIPRYEERTIFGEVEGKVSASVVQLSARPPGFGNRCQHLIYEIARAAGIQDLAARTPRSRNPMNVIKATIQALTSQKLPEEVARARGRKLVDVRKVYYGGQVY